MDGSSSTVHGHSKPPVDTFISHLLFYAEGKKSMLDGVGAFNRMASEAYKRLQDGEKERLENMAASTGDRAMKPSEVKRMAAKIFKKIQNEIIFVEQELLRTQAVQNTYSGPSHA